LSTTPPADTLLASCNIYLFHLQSQVTFDDVSKVAYLIGGNSVHVIDVSSAAVDITSSTARVLPILLTRNLPTTITDVVMCGDLIAISAEGASKVSPGQVLLYSRYLRSGSADSLKLMANFTVGEYKHTAGTTRLKIYMLFPAFIQPGSTISQHHKPTSSCMRWCAGALPGQIEFSKSCRTAAYCSFAIYPTTTGPNTKL
jgi:hypothetical protein